MSYNFDLLKGKQIVDAINSLTNFIDDTHDAVYELAIKTKDHSDKFFNEYGFYINSKDKSVYVFFGMWYSYWEETGNALCLMYSWNSLDEPGFKQKFEEFVEARPAIFTTVIDFEEVPVASFTSEFLNGLEDSKPIAIIIHELIQYIGLDFEKLKN